MGAWHGADMLATEFQAKWLAFAPAVLCGLLQPSAGTQLISTHCWVAGQ